MKFLLLTGLSGAGKTSAVRYLEDLGAFCVDNLPPMMLIKFMEACQTSAIRQHLAALAVDVRSGEFFDANAVRRVLNEATALGYNIETIFLQANDDVLISRYKETRRDHPLASEQVSLTEAITRERELLEPLRETANYVIDTSAMRPRALQKQLAEIAAKEKAETGMRVELMSFGFKRGIPRQSDLVLDVRFLPNPFYIPELGHQTGRDEAVRTFVMEHPVTRVFMEKTRDLLDFLMPHYAEEGKQRIVIAIGCTGGAHRSVAITEALAGYLQTKGYPVDMNHRDLEAEQALWKAGS